MNLIEIAQKMDASSSSEPWYEEKKHNTPLQNLLLQTLWSSNQQGGTLPSLSSYVEAAQRVEQEMKALLTTLDIGKEHSRVDLIEALWLQHIGAIDADEKITYVYDDHYGDYLHFSKNGKVNIDFVQDYEPDTYEWYYGEPARSSVEHFCQDVYSVLGKVEATLLRIPWGNLIRFGGRRGVIQTLIDAKSLEGYAQ